MYKAARIVLMMLLLSRSAYGSDGSSLPSGARLQFATVHTPEDVEFVREQLVKYLYVGVL